MKIFSLLFILILSQNGIADEYQSVEIERQHIKSASFVAPLWEDYTNKDGSGVYWEVIKSIYEPLGIKVKTKNVPWNRAMKMVSKYRTYNAILGEYRDTEEKVIFPDYPIDIEYMSLLTKNSTGIKFDNLTSLKGKTVGWIKDYEVIAKDKRDFKLREFRSIEQGIKFLNNGKIDFLIDDWDEIAAAMSRHKMSTDNYTVDEMPEGTPIYAAFSKDKLSEELIRIYNERIPVLQKAGKMEEIYKKWDNAELPEAVINSAN